MVIAMYECRQSAGARLYSKAVASGTLNPTKDEIEAEATNVDFRRAVGLYEQEQYKKTSKELSSEHADDLKRIEHYAQFLHAPGFIGIQTIIASAIIQTWTAFETAASHAWVAIVNIKPNWISLDEKFISGKTLRSYGYNLTGKIGNALYDDGIYKFKNVAAIHEAFKSILNGTEEIFENDNLSSRMRWLHALRNVLVHQSGKADQFFLDRMKGNPKYDNQEIGWPVKYTGSEAADYINATLRITCQLLELADGQIINRPEMPK